MLLEGLGPDHRLHFRAECYHAGVDAAWSQPTPLNDYGGAPALKRALATTLRRSGLLRLDLQTRGSGVAMAIGYHGTPSENADLLSQHFAFYRNAFTCLGEEQLLAFLRGELRLSRPGIVITFDDGALDHAQVAAPLLRQHGLRGWFMIPGGCLGETASVAEGSTMTWGMVRSLLEEGHAVGCHSWSHRTLGEGVPQHVVDDEVSRAKQLIAERLGRDVRAFAWVRGRVEDYSPQAQRAIARTFELGFTSLGRSIRPGDGPLALHRFHVESSFPLDVVRFQMSRFNELAFARRRWAARRLLRP